MNLPLLFSVTRNTLIHVKILEQLRYTHECSMFCEIRYNKFETYTVNWKDLLRVQLPVKSCKPQVWLILLLSDLSTPWAITAPYRGGSRIFFRRGCSRLLLYFNTNKPFGFFFLQNTSCICIRKPQVISGGGRGGARTPSALPLDPLLP